MSRYDSLRQVQFTRPSWDFGTYMGRMQPGNYGVIWSIALKYYQGKQVCLGSQQ